MPKLAKNAAAMTRSGIREISERVFAMQAQGKGPFISLTAGEPSFRAAPHIAAAATKQLNDGHMGYIENGGLPALRQAIAARLSVRHGVATSPANVLVSIGAMGCLSSSAMALLNAGDEVLVPDPGYPNYGMIFALLGVKMVPYACPGAAGFQPDLADLAAKISPKTAEILVCNPSNPTGAVIPGETLDALAALAHQHDLWLLMMRYMRSWSMMRPSPPSSRVPRNARSIYSGFSKTYAMTGYRMGYMRGPAELIAKVSDMHEALVSCGVPAAQMGAFYLMLALPELRQNSREFALNLLAKHQVAVAPGSAFGPGGEGHVRLSLAGEEADILEGLSRLIHLYQHG